MLNSKELGQTFKDLPPGFPTTVNNLKRMTIMNIKSGRELLRLFHTSDYEIIFSDRRTITSRSCVDIQQRPFESASNEQTETKNETNYSLHIPKFKFKIEFKLADLIK